ncbi:MAG TPA: alpha-amylase, partial [Candidatus Omnitrophota bacterium]|nr:alpha-amylase [Candidatus Omnitrophota bacterium]
FGLLTKRSKSLPEQVQTEVRPLLEKKDEVLKKFQTIHKIKIATMRIRCHGDYHLGQVLYTGKDFVIIDFEGEPASSLEERKIKRSPLRDVAGMLRSFHYAAYGSILDKRLGGGSGFENYARLEPWARFWYVWVSSAYLKAYLETAKESAFLPKRDEELTVMLDVYVLEKAIYELNYELNNRPDWIEIPVKGVAQILNLSA